MSSTSALSLSNRGDFDLGWLKPAELNTTSAAMGGELGSADWQLTPERLAATGLMNSPAMPHRSHPKWVSKPKAIIAMLRAKLKRTACCAALLQPSSSSVQGEFKNGPIALAQLAISAA